MKVLNIKTAFILSLVANVFILSSCHEKGCTDKNAVNYNSVADEDDGSCITCQGETEEIGTAFEQLYDNNSLSPHFNQLVAIFTVTQVQDKFTYSECGSNSCRFNISIESLVNENMSFSFSMSCSGNVSFNFQKSVSVPAHQNVLIGTVPSTNISNPCGFLTSSSVFVSLQTNISYN